jgi:hypothetical protein
MRLCKEQIKYITFSSDVQAEDYTLLITRPWGKKGRKNTQNAMSHTQYLKLLTSVV